MSIPRRELAELYAKYDLHPNLMEIYVEGEFDYTFLSLFLEEIGAQNSTVVCIDDIEIDNTVTDRFKLNGGSNKNRVLGLAGLLDERYKTRPTNVCCLVDVDLDLILAKQKIFHHAVYTDYNCLEMYLLNRVTIKRFLVLGCGLDEAACVEFFQLAELILPVQFALRAVNESAKIFKATLEFETGLTKKKKFSTFDASHYCNAYINYYSLGKRRAEIVSEFTSISARLPPDMRNCINGHDFVHLLFEFIYLKGSLKLHDKAKSEVQYGGRLIAMAANLKQLLTDALFANISNAASGGAPLRP